MTDANPPARADAEPAALIWRLLAMVYDTLPVVALWFLFSFVVVALRGAPIPPWSLAFWLQNVALLALTGAYAVGSWARGGQTLGMRPWRLRVVDASGCPATVPALLARYAGSLLSWAALGLGFLWSLVDRERCTWHDRLSGTRLIRLPRL